MYVWLIIGLGGFIGAILRFLISGWIQNQLVTFPLGTLGVNFIGSLLLGFIMYSSEYGGFFTDKTRIFLTIGLLGAFTTMSTFSYESYKLLEQKRILLFGTNIFGTVTLTIFAVYIGKVIATIIFRS